MTVDPEAMHSSKESLWQKSMVIVFAVVSYWVVSISMVFLNNYLLSGGIKLDAALFITWFQCLVAVVVLFVASRFASSTHVTRDGLPRLEFDIAIAKQVLPLSIVFACMIGFNNLCLKFVGVAFYTVARSLSTVFNVVIMYLVLGERTSAAAITCCAVLTGGFLLGVQQEGSAGSLSVVGLLFGVLSSLFVSLNSTYVKKVLPAVDSNTWRLTYYNNINCCILFVPLIIGFGEVSTILSFPLLFDPYWWFMMTMGGLLGIAIAVVTTNQIKFTSPLTHLVSATAKAAAQTVMAVIIANDSKSGLWWLSNTLVLGGSVAYGEVRRKEMQVAHEKEHNTSVIKT